MSRFGFFLLVFSYYVDFIFSILVQGFEYDVVIVRWKFDFWFLFGGRFLGEIGKKDMRYQEILDENVVKIS